MRTVLFIFTLFLFIPAKAQSHFNSVVFWQKLKYDKSIPPTLPLTTDTAFVVVSNRMVNNDGLRFIGELKDDSLHYYFVYSVNDKWHVYPTASLSEALQYLPHPNKDWVIYIEGFGKIFTEGLNRGIRLNAQYGVNVLYLDYPGYNTKKKMLGNYRFAKENAIIAGRVFLPVLDSVRYLKAGNKMGSGHLSFFLHSMGNLALREMVYSPQFATINKSKWIDNLILNAPCVPQKHHREWLEQVHFAKHIYVHYNPKDFVLRGAHILSGQRLLGEKLRQPLANDVTYINFHQLVNKWHSNFLELVGYPMPHAEAKQHYQALFNGDTVNINDRQLYTPSYYHHRGFDIVKRQ